MNLPDFSIKSPYAIIAVALLVTVLGLFAFKRTPIDLFPETTPPQVVVITAWPGADSGDIADKITQVIEKELNTVGGLKRISSTSRDEVSSINAEFYYTKDLGEAVLDVQNAVSRIQAALPDGIMAPRIYRISSATRPLLTIALSPKEGSHKSLSEIRLLAKNQIEDALLNINGVADVDVFGGNMPEVKVFVDRTKLAANAISLSEVLAALSRNNLASPSGTIYAPDQEYLMKVAGEYQNLDEIRNLPIVERDGGILRLRDVGRVELGIREQRSFYHGNAKPAIAVNVMRQEGGDTVRTIHNIKDFLPKLERQYPGLSFTITDDQQPIIDLNVSGMKSSLIQAILLTIAVIFLFLADIRTAAIVAISIPLAFLFSLTVLWFSPYTINMVTLSGLIISVGMVVDASVVVLENIFRHYTKDPDKDAKRAASIGSKEVALATTAGMLTTVIVLIPVMFAGGYTEQTMRPLSMMIVATLVASLITALTVVPLMASRLLKRSSHKRNWFEKIFSRSDVLVEKLGGFYVFILKGALKVRWLVLLISVVFLAFTMKKVKPMLGGELMPRMDTGIVNVVFETPSGYTPDQTNLVLSKIEAELYKSKSVVSMSSTIGSEPGEISFGGGGANAQSGSIKVILTDRLHRDKDIWKIQDIWRERLGHILAIKSFQISEYGATPVSTTRAPLDIIISGPDSQVLDHLGKQVMLKLNGIPGLVDVKRSWNIDKPDVQIKINPDLATFYKASQQNIANELKVAVKGVPATAMRLNGYLDIPILLRYDGSDISTPQKMEEIPVQTGVGQVPLRALAALEPHMNQPFITREKLQSTLDITGINRGHTIAHVTEMVNKKLANFKLPAGYTIQVAGSAVNMKSGQVEMGNALTIGIIILLVLLIAMFRSFLHPFTIMAAIPLAIAGGFWGLLLFDKPMCKPAMMGMILLGGTIVNNSILILDFIINAREDGMSKNEAIIHAVQLRLRPILMTTVSTIIGLTPLIFELAVGLERMSPLGIVAASGLLVGTFLTMIVVPVIYSLLDSLSVNTRKLLRIAD